MTSSRQISFDDLPRYSNWPARLLGLEPFEARQKTAQEVTREYQVDKWGQLRERMDSLESPAILDMESAFVDLDTPLPCFEEGRFFVGTERIMLEKHLRLYEDVLAPYLDTASCLVELGAGFGSKLLALGQREAFSKTPLMAFEYTQNGRALISMLAKSSRRQMTIGHCDFRTMQIEGAEIPENAIIFTSYSVHYVPWLHVDFLDFLADFKPRAVIHFEPCYEYYPKESLHGLMCRRYVELNDYNRNLATLVESRRELDKASLRVRKNMLGSNPFLPASVIEWSHKGIAE